MTQIISRMYATKENASKAFDELKRRNYQDVFLFAAPDAGESGEASFDTDDLIAQMMKAHILKSDARIFAERVAKGGNLVTVHAPFSGGFRAFTVLDSYDPIESGVAKPVFPSAPWDSKTPCSSALRMPVLAKNKLPFETVSAVPSLTRCGAVTACLGMPALSKSATPFSSMFGMSALSKNPTPFSSMFGMPLTKKGTITT